MKITHNKVGQNLNRTDTAKSEKTGNSGKATDLSDKNSIVDALGSGEAQGSSKVQLSKRAQDIKRAKEIAMATPDVREDRVQELQKLIDNGKYKVDAKDIADKMVDEESQWT